MTDFSPKYGADSGGSMTVTNLQSLADNAFWESAALENDTTKAQVKELFITIATTTTAGDAGGFAAVYIAGSVDGGTDYEGTAPDGTESTETFDASMERNMDLVATIPIDASETTARTFRQRVRIGLPPKDYVVVLENQTGAALASSGNAVEEMEIQGTDA